MNAPTPSHFPRSVGRGGAIRLLADGLRSLGLGLLLLGPAPSARTEGTVTASTTAALLQALAGGGKVRIEASNPIVLDLPLVISVDTVIEGVAVTGRTITLSGGGNYRILHVLPGVRLELRGVTLREGVSTNGGALLNEGLLVADTVVFTACEASGPNGADGVDGGVRFGFGQDGTSAGSGTPAAGGAVYNRGEAWFSNCSFLVNEAGGGSGGVGGNGGVGASKSGYGGYGGGGAGGWGGAIANLGLATVTNCFFSGNVARAGDGGAGGTGNGVLGSGQGGAGGAAGGGAVHNLGNLLLASSSFTTNLVIAGSSADAGAPSIVAGEDGPPGGIGYGGAVSSWSTGAVVNCTFFTNLVSGGDGGKGVAGSAIVGAGGNGGAALGGAIHARGFLALTNVTLAWNAAGGGAAGTGAGGLGGPDGAAGVARGAALAADTGAVVRSVNSIMATDLELDLAGLSGPFQDLGHNLFNDAGPDVLGPGSRRHVDPRLSAFAVWTTGQPGFLPVAGSPAIDAADAAAAPPFDQRGVVRGTGQGPEIGALEAGAVSSGFRLAGHVYSSLAGTNGVSGLTVLVGTNAVVTDVFGRFEFQALPGGPYSVELENGGIGYQPRVHQLVLTADVLNLVFRPAASKLTLVWNGVEGVHELNGSGVPDRVYHLETSVDLRQWTTVASSTADAQGRTTFRRQPGAAPEVYYRLRNDP